MEEILASINKPNKTALMAASQWKFGQKSVGVVKMTSFPMDVFQMTSSMGVIQ